MDDFDFEDEYMTEETEMDLDEDYDPTDLSEIWHPDVADTLQFAYYLSLARAYY